MSPPPTAPAAPSSTTATRQPPATLPPLPPAHWPVSMGVAVYAASSSSSTDVGTVASLIRQSRVIPANECLVNAVHESPARLFVRYVDGSFVADDALHGRVFVCTQAELANVLSNATVGDKATPYRVLVVEDGHWRSPSPSSSSSSTTTPPKNVIYLPAFESETFSETSKRPQQSLESLRYLVHSLVVDLLRDILDKLHQRQLRLLGTTNKQQPSTSALPQHQLTQAELQCQLGQWDEARQVLSLMISSGHSIVFHQQQRDRVRALLLLLTIEWLMLAYGTEQQREQWWSKTEFDLDDKKQPQQQSRREGVQKPVITLTERADRCFTACQHVCLGTSAPSKTASQTPVASSIALFQQACLCIGELMADVYARTNADDSTWFAVDGDLHSRLGPLTKSTVAKYLMYVPASLSDRSLVMRLLRAYQHAHCQRKFRQALHQSVVVVGSAAHLLMDQLLSETTPSSALHAALAREYYHLTRKPRFLAHYLAHSIRTSQPDTKRWLVEMRRALATANDVELSVVNRVTSISAHDHYQPLFSSNNAESPVARADSRQALFIHDPRAAERAGTADDDLTKLIAAGQPVTLDFSLDRLPSHLGMYIYSVECEFSASVDVRVKTALPASKHLSMSFSALAACPELSLKRVRLSFGDGWFEWFELPVPLVWQVIPAQPLLKVLRTNLTRDREMELFAGEHAQMTLTLVNHSDLAATILSADIDGPLAQPPSLPIDVAPNRHPLQIMIPICGEGASRRCSVTFTYTLQSSREWLRQLVVDVDLTVREPVRLLAMHGLPRYRQSTTVLPRATSVQSFTVVTDGSEGTSPETPCLVFDVANRWRKPVTLRVDLHAGERSLPELDPRLDTPNSPTSPTQSTKAILDANQTKRIIIPVQELDLKPLFTYLSETTHDDDSHAARSITFDTLDIPPPPHLKREQFFLDEGDDSHVSLKQRARKAKRVLCEYLGVPGDANVEPWWRATMNDDAVTLYDHWQQLSHRVQRAEFAERQRRLRWWVKDQMLRRYVCALSWEIDEESAARSGVLDLASLELSDRCASALLKSPYDVRCSIANTTDHPYSLTIPLYQTSTKPTQLKFEIPTPLDHDLVLRWLWYQEIAESEGRVSYDLREQMSVGGVQDLAIIRQHGKGAVSKTLDIRFNTAGVFKMLWSVEPLCDVGQTSHGTSPRQWCRHPLTVHVQ